MITAEDWLDVTTGKLRKTWGMWNRPSSGPWVRLLPFVEGGAPPLVVAEGMKLLDGVRSG